MTEFAPGRDTSTDVYIEVHPRKAGVESGRFYGSWFDCPYEIWISSSNPTKIGSAVFWEVTFVATDIEYQGVKFNGSANTRAHAKALITDTITKQISQVSEARKAAAQAAALAKPAPPINLDGLVVAPYTGFWVPGWLGKLWGRFLWWWTHK